MASTNFSQWLRETTEGLVMAFVRPLAKLGIGPNALTVAGVLVASVGAIFAARGQFALAALWVALGTPFDALDGSLARLTGKASDFGALLDSTLDRYGEAALLTGLGVYMSTQANTLGLVLVFVTLLGSVMVSYVRARSEGLGLSNKVGLFTRVERILLTFLMLIAGAFAPVAVTIGLGVLAVGTQFTVLQRLAEARRQV
jgi:CDP-diacylglycerol--glycerol-3-phosphate 3-phosphatidyltransferase